MGENGTCETDQQSDLIVSGPNKSKVDRCQTIIGCHKYWYDTDSGKIKFNSVLQADGKMKYVPNFFISTFAPKTIGDWWKGVTAYVNKNHNKSLKPEEEAPEMASPRKELI